MWQELTSDPEIFNTVKGLNIDFMSNPWQNKTPNQERCSLEESRIIESEINKLLVKGVIIPATNEPGEFISIIFLRSKPDGTHLMILNLKKLNESVLYQHFKIDTLCAVVRKMNPNCYMASIDMEDAYYSVPVADSNKKKKHVKFE